MRMFAITVLLGVLIPATGISSGAMMFDGDGDYVNIADDNSLDITGDITTSSWVKGEYVTDGTYIVAKRDGLNNQYGVLAGAAGNIYFYTWGADSHLAANSGALPENEWTHVVTTFSEGVGEIYINGIPSAIDLTATPITTASSDVFIGARGDGAGGSSYNWDGSIDEVLIYNKSLTASEVQAMYASGGAWYPKDGLVSRWSMDGNGVSTGQAHANGSTIKDSHGSNDGTVADGADGSMTLESSPVRQKRGRR